MSFKSKEVIQTSTDLGLMFLTNVYDGYNAYTNKLSKALTVDNMEELLIKAQAQETKPLEIETYEYLD